MSHQHWNVIADADSGGIVLAIDFPVTGRREAGFPELVAQFGPGFSWWQTVPPRVSPETPIPGAEYVAPWIEEVRRIGRPVHAVLGYCLGAVYGAAIADGIAAFQADAPKLVLFDPEIANVMGLSLELQRVLGDFGALLSAEEIEGARHLAAELAETHLEDVPGFASGLVRLYREYGGAAFEQVGLDTTSRAELMALFESYMAWMSAADGIDPESAWAGATAITSNSPGYLLQRRRAERPGAPALVGTEIPFDLDHADLLRSDVVAKTVAELLES
jgi:hypothetical protein